MFFAIITFFAAFSIEGIGTLVSVIGLSSLFGSNPIIIALAIVLDIGKLVVVTLLYKYWSKLGFLMKSYGLIAACVTMIITSAGAAGYLSGEFQKAMVGTQESGLKVDVLKAQIAKFEERKKQIDDQIAKLPEKTTVNQRLRLMNGFKAEQADLQAKINEIDKQLPALQIAQIGVEAKAGPILFIAKAFDIPVETAVKWVILMIIFVFDPLAVFLIIAGNFLLDRRRAEQIEGASLMAVAGPEVDVWADDPDRGNPSVISMPNLEEEQLKQRVKIAEEVAAAAPPQVHVEVPEQTVKFSTPDASQANVYNEQDLKDMGVSPEVMRDAGFTVPEPEIVISREGEDFKVTEEVPPAEPIYTELKPSFDIEAWKKAQLEKLDRLETGASIIANGVKREEITKSSLGLVKPDPATQTSTDAAPARDPYEVGQGTGARVTGAPKL